MTKRVKHTGSLILSFITALVVLSIAVFVLGGDLPEYKIGQYDWHLWFVCGVPYVIALTLAIYAYIIGNRK